MSIRFFDIFPACKCNFGLIKRRGSSLFLHSSALAAIREKATNNRKSLHSKMCLACTNEKKKKNFQKLRFFFLNGFFSRISQFSLRFSTIDLEILNIKNCGFLLVNYSNSLNIRHVKLEFNGIFFSFFSVEMNIKRVLEKLSHIQLVCSISDEHIRLTPSIAEWI